MKITIQLDEHIYKATKRLASKTNKTISAVIEAALLDFLSKRKNSPRKSLKVSLPTFDGNGLQPGVELDDTCALLDLMSPDKRVFH